VTFDPTADPRPTLAAPDDDPYLWLEEVDGERALAWVEAQNRASLARFFDARCAADRDLLAAILDRPDNLPLITRRGAALGLTREDWLQSRPFFQGGRATAMPPFDWRSLGREVCAQQLS
jgi:hypothetical protein